MQRIMRSALIAFLLSMLPFHAFTSDSLLSPKKIEVPTPPRISAIIDVEDSIKEAKEVKPGAVGMDENYWGERKSSYFGALELSERKGLQYTEPLEIEETKGRKHYEHIYHGKTLTEIDYRNETGNLETDETNESAVIRLRYDKNGDLVEESSYNPDGTLKNDWYGFAIYRWVYNSAHLRIQGSFYDAEGKLAKKKFSEVAIHRWIYNDKGEITIWANYDTNGVLAKDILGVAATRYEYDKNKREILQSNYGIDRRLTNNKNGFAAIVHKYDDENRTEFIAYYDKNLKPFEVKGVSFEQVICDKNNKWTEDAFYDVKGNLRNNSDGAAVICSLNDAKGRMVHQKIYDANANLIDEWELDEKTGQWHRIDGANTLQKMQ